MAFSWEHRIPSFLSTHFLRNCPPTADTQIYKQFHPFSSSSVKSSLTNPRGRQSPPKPPGLSTAHSQLSNQAQGKQTGALMFLFSSWPNPHVLTTQGAGWRSRTHPQHTEPDTCPQIVPKPEFSSRSRSGHRGSATSLQRLCLIQKAPAKSIPTPDKLFSILASTFHPSGMKKSSQLSPRLPAEPKGRGDVGSRDLSPSAGPQHTLSLSTALTKIPTGCRTGIWESSGNAELCRAWNSLYQA